MRTSSTFCSNQMAPCIITCGVEDVMYTLHGLLVTFYAAIQSKIQYNILEMVTPNKLTDCNGMGKL